MSLFKSKSKRAFQHNMETEMDSGKPKAQSLAIAYNVKRKSSKKAMAEGGEVDKHKDNHAYNYDDSVSVKGVNKVAPKFSRELNSVRHGESESQNRKDKHQKVLEEMKSMPKPNIKGLAEGGKVQSSPKKQPKMAEITGPFKVKMRDEQDEDPQMLNDGGIVDTIKAAFEDDPKPKSAPTPVPTPNPDNIKKYGIDKAFAEGGEVHDMYDSMDEEELEHHSSIAAAIMAKREHQKMMAEGGQVDIDENETEESANPSTFDEMNEEAPEHDFDSDMDSLEQPEDSNEQDDDIESDKHDRIAEIRKRRKMAK